MTYILEAVIEALKLLFSFNTEVYSVILLSLGVSLLSTIIASILGVILALLLVLYNGLFRKTIIRIIHTFMGLPPVVVGLFVLIILSRKGPLGELGLLFSVPAMIIAQSLLVLPIIMGIVFDNVNKDKQAIVETVKSLSGNKFDMIKMLIIESKVAISIAIVTGFGRAISEVGAVMLVGGNISGKTRVMTTFIALNSSMGEYSLAIAMGIILLLISFIINFLLEVVIGGKKNEN